MKQILYLEAPTPDTAAVRHWLQKEWTPHVGEKVVTPDGLRLQFPQQKGDRELSLFVWSFQRTTYLKLFQWGSESIAGTSQICQQLTKEINKRFPPEYPEPPEIDLSQESIFTALEPYYPETVRYFQKMPQGEYDLQRVYWWEKGWRESVRNPQKPKQVIYQQEHRSNSTQELSTSPNYDLIYIGGALGVIHGAVMAKLGYKVLLVERLGFGRMNREWNISRSEFQSLIDLGLFTEAEFTSIIASEYLDGFSKFFDGNNPPHLKAPVLHTPTVLNIAIDTEKMLNLCAEKLRDAGGGNLGANGVYSSRYWFHPGNGAIARLSGGRTQTSHRKIAGRCHGQCLSHCLATQWLSRL